MWFRKRFKVINFSDPRTKDWFLVTSPGPIIMIVVSYIYFSTSAGPRYMRDKKPYTLRNTLIIYNFIQVLLSIYLVYEGVMSGWWNDYSFRCQPVDYSNNPKALRVRIKISLVTYFKTIIQTFKEFETIRILNLPKQ